MLKPCAQVGLVGAGKQMREYLAPSVLATGARLVGVSAGSGKSLDTFHRRFGQTVCYADSESLISSGAVDRVVCAARADVHEHTVRLCIEAGIPVLTEKPPCIGSARLRSLVEAARDGAVCVGMNFRRAVPVTRYQALLGELTRSAACLDAQIVFRSGGTSARAPMFGGRAPALCYELGIHAIDLAVHVFGATKLSRYAIRCSASVLILRLDLENPNTGTTVQVEVMDGAPRFSSAVSALTDTGARVSLRDLDSIVVENAPGLDCYEPQLGLPAEMSFRWPTRKSSLERNGYIPLMEDFLHGRYGACADLPSLMPTYELIEQVLQ